MSTTDCQWLSVGRRRGTAHPRRGPADNAGYWGGNDLLLTPHNRSSAFIPHTPRATRFWGLVAAPGPAPPPFRALLPRPPPLRPGLHVFAISEA